MKIKMLTAVTSLLMAAFPAGLKAQGKIARLTCYEVKADFRDSFLSVLNDYVTYSMKQESNILSEAYYEEDNPSVCWIIERWNNITSADKAAKHNTFAAVGSFAEKILLAPPKIYDVTDLEPLSKKQWRTAPNANDEPITIMLFVDSKAGTENEFKNVYHKAMPQFRSEAGVINYQLSQLKSESTKFVTYEKFRNEEAFQYHLKFPPIQPVIQYLETSIKIQPFQQGLHRLIAFKPL